MSKKFYAEDNERHKLDEATIDREQKLLKTIRISRNLFSLTERLPKSKYHLSPPPQGIVNERTLEKTQSSAAILVPPGSQGASPKSLKRSSVDETRGASIPEEMVGGQDLQHHDDPHDNAVGSSSVIAAIHKRNNSIVPSVANKK